MFKLLLTLTLLGVPLKSIAGTEGGGGGTMVLVNDKWTLQDYFGSHVMEGQPFRLKGEPLEAFKTVLGLVSNYSHVQQPALKQFLTKRMITDAEFRFISKLPCKDKSSSSKLLYGCTKDGVTYLIRERFELLSNTDRIFALLHERLHDIKKNQDDHTWINPYVYTARILYDYLLKQLDGDRANLFPSELKLLKDLIVLNDSLTYNMDINGLKYTTAYVLRSGGVVRQLSANGKYWDPLQEEMAYHFVNGSFLSVGSGFTLLNRNGDTIDNSQILFSQVVASVIKDSILKNSSVNNLARPQFNGAGNVVNSEIVDSFIHSNVFIFIDAPVYKDKFIGIDISDSHIRSSSISTMIHAKDASGTVIRICKTTLKDISVSGDSYINCK